MTTGRMHRETNPIPGEKPGFTPQYKNTDGSFIEVTPDTPYPVTDKDVYVELQQVKAELQALKERLEEPLFTQLTGSNVVLLKQFLGDNNGIGKNYYNYGSDTALSSNDITPLDVSECKEKTIIIINNYDVQINIAINYYSTLSKTSYKRAPIDTISLASGASIFLDKSKIPQLSAPIVGMGVSIVGKPSSGSIDILFFGSRF